MAVVTAVIGGMLTGVGEFIVAATLHWEEDPQGKVSRRDT